MRRSVTKICKSTNIIGLRPFSVKTRIFLRFSGELVGALPPFVLCQLAPHSKVAWRHWDAPGSPDAGGNDWADSSSKAQLVKTTALKFEFQMWNMLSSSFRKTLGHHPVGVMLHGHAPKRRVKASTIAPPHTCAISGWVCWTPRKTWSSERLRTPTEESLATYTWLDHKQTNKQTRKQM